MANNAFDRTNVGLRERPVSADLNRAYSQADRSLRDSLRYLLSARSLTSPAGVPYTGFIGDGFRVVPTSPIGMSVQLTAGLGFFYTPIDLPVDLGALDLEGVDDRSAFKPMILTAPQSFAVPAAPTAGNSRIDIIEARYDRRLEDPQVRRQLDPSSKAFNDHIFNKTLSFTLDGQVGTVNSPSPSTAPLSYKVGAVAATGTEIEPSLTPGYIQLARVNVGPNVTTIDRGVIVDRRPLLAANGGVTRASLRFKLDWNGGAPTVTIEAIAAPPSVELYVAPSTLAKGQATVIVFGGHIQGATATISGQSFVGSGPPPLIVLERQVGGAGASLPAAALAGLFTISATPSITNTNGVSQQVVQVPIKGYELTAGGPDATTANVESILVNMDLALTY